MTFCLHCSYIPVSLNNKEPKSFKLKSVISVMPFKPAHAFQREGEGVIKRERIREESCFAAPEFVIYQILF